MPASRTCQLSYCRLAGSAGGDPGDWSDRSSAKAADGAEPGGPGTMRVVGEWTECVGALTGRRRTVPLCARALRCVACVRGCVEAGGRKRWGKGLEGRGSGGAGGAGGAGAQGTGWAIRGCGGLCPAPVGYRSVLRTHAHALVPGSTHIRISHSRTAALCAATHAAANNRARTHARACAAGAYAAVTRQGCATW
jgi:hypothetical protein